MSWIPAPEAHFETGELRPWLCGVDHLGLVAAAMQDGTLPADGHELLPGLHGVGIPAEAGIVDNHVEKPACIRLHGDAERAAEGFDILKRDVVVFDGSAPDQQHSCNSVNPAHVLGSNDRWVSAYIDIPFLAKGRTRTGLDCWGLVRLVYAEQCGVSLPLWLDGYAETVPCDGTAAHLAACAATFAEIPAMRAMPGDILLFRTGRHLSHVALALTGGRMLHAMAGVDSCVENYLSPKWKPRLVGAYRPEVRHG